MHLNKPALCAVVEDALAAQGWNVHSPSSFAHPRHLTIVRGEVKHDLCIYIWNVTHGGGRARAADEYRIQMTGVSSPLVIPNDRITLLLGYYDHPNGPVLVAWDPQRHLQFGVSPSLQVKEGALDAALEQGLVVTTKNDDEHVVVIRPEMLEVYLGAQRQLHLGNAFGQPDEVHDTTAAYLATVSNVQEVEQDVNSSGAFDPTDALDARRKTMASIVRRQGQPAFRQALLQAYAGACAVTGYTAKAALEAAHIMPYLGEYTNRVTNGLLLRSDIHTLFDQGLITVDATDMTVIVHPSLMDTEYAQYNGVALSVPTNPAYRPNVQALDLHRSGSGL